MIKYTSNYSSIYEEHRKIWNFFPDDRGATRDFIYRRIDSGDLPQYYILSERTPINEQEIWTIETKDFNPVIKNKDVLHFNLRANPVVTKKVNDMEPEKRKRDDVYMEALARYKKLPETERPTNNQILVESGLKWIMERSDSYGFFILKDEVIVERYHRLEGLRDKDKHRIQLGVIDYSGILEVTNAKVFVEKALKNGIGHGKAFGCGLVLIRRL